MALIEWKYCLANFLNFAIEEIMNSKDTHFESSYGFFNSYQIVFKQLSKALYGLLKILVNKRDEDYRLRGYYHERKTLIEWKMYFRGQ